MESDAVNARLAWADELRDMEGLPPRGESPETARAREAVARLNEVLGVEAEVVSADGGSVVLAARACRFIVRSDGALFFQPTDTDGNSYGKALPFASRKELIPLLEKS